MNLDINVFLANMSLAQLNYQAQSRSEKPIVLEVAKAMTLALLHRDIEARVVCRTQEEITDAAWILIGRKHAATWNKAAGALEFSNGSAVVLKYEPKRTEGT